MSARIRPLRASPTRPWLLAMPDRRLRRSAVGMTAGMMSYVCIEELLPAAYAEKGVPRSKLTAAFFAGCAVMASSLVLEKMLNDG